MNLLYKPHEYSQQRQREKKRWIWPVHLAMEATYWHERGHTVVWDDSNAITPTHFFARVITEPEGIPFSKLPAANRIITKAFDPKYQENGNYKHNPGTYIQSAAGCWWGKCTFCKERCNKFELRPVDPQDIHTLHTLNVKGPLLPKPSEVNYSPGCFMLDLGREYFIGEFFLANDIAEERVNGFANRVLSLAPTNHP